MYRTVFILSVLIFGSTILAGCVPSQPAIQTANTQIPATLPTAASLFSTETAIPNPTAIPTLTLVPTPSFSSASFNIVFESNADSYGDIYITDSNVNDIRNLTRSLTKDWNPTWSPDGSMIAYLTNPDDYRYGDEAFINIIDNNGENPLHLTYVSGRITDIAWSPDSNRLASVSYFDVSHYVLTIHPVGENEQIALLENFLRIYSIAWSPDGEKIVFVSEDDSYETGISTFNLQAVYLDTKEITLITSIPLPSGASDFPGIPVPSWSPDGSQLAFISDWNQESGTGIIYTAKDGNQLESLNIQADDMHLAWSPDGSRIAYSVDRDLFVTDLHGNTARLTNVEEDELLWWTEEPSWSPDGSMIAFLGDVNSGLCPELFIVLPDGSSMVRLAPDLMINHFAWSPDSTLLVVSSIGVLTPCPDCEGPSTDERRGIYLINVIEGTFEFLAESGYPSSPAFQPSP